ncbi:Subtilisin BL [bacterium HR07]|uniref:Subtilase family protein n=2 Tax=Candidatus Bipolaricaulota TaxID=67810 RepID=H5SDI6_9BACT|nr:subtilase family protein [uncultured Acetothermia bacterium]BAL60252.1 subtilase family protein [Candidatus Acetothermum autotrophicum]GBC75826.1 Subtilisin BL [bacterium HR07]
MRTIAKALVGVLVGILWAGGVLAQFGQGPDLIVQGIKVTPENPKPGDVVTIAVTVANVGNEDVSSSFFVCISVNLMPDVVATELGLPLNELLLGRDQVRRLERNRQATVTLQWQIAELPLIRFRASVDCAFNQVREQNEENNRLEQPLRIEERYINQWWLDQIQARQAHEITLGSPEIVVAVLDSGVDWQHPELINNMWVNPKEIPDNNKDDDGNGFIDDIHGWDFYDNDNDSLEGTTIDFHGTSVAGIIANAADNIGLTGVAPKVKIMDVRAFDPKGRATVDTIVKALDYAVANGARIVNMSFGGLGCFELPGQLRQAVERALDKDVLLVAAAGNFGEAFPSCVSYPAAYPGVIAVGATGTDGNVTSYSQGGSKLDVVAPGGDISYEKFLELAAKIENFEQFLPLLKTAILTPYPFGGYGPFFGTSAAAPHVSGVLALILSVNPKLSANEAAFILRSTATGRSPRSRYGYGVVNALRAVQQAKGGF